MLEVPLLEYRPPPPSRVFPDVLAHALIYPFGGDLLTQKIIAGTAIFLLSAVLIGMYKGRAAFSLYILITVCCGFGFLNTGYHYSLPLTLLLYQLARRTRADLPVLFLVVFSDVLLLMPLAMLFVQRAERHDLRRVLLTSALAFVASVWYSEFSEAIADFAIVLPVFCIVTVVANRLGLLRTLIVACCVLLPVGAMLGVVPARYGLPVAATMLLLLFETVRAELNWRHFAAPAIIIAVFLMTVDRNHLDRLEGGYRCLIGELQKNNVDAVAVEYWTARPLYYAARKSNVTLTITQTDFLENDSDAFMAPYSFYGVPTHWAVRNNDTCATFEPGPKSCNQPAAGKVLFHASVCGIFELYRYEETVPHDYLPPPRTKSESISRHLQTYVSKALSRLQRQVERLRGSTDHVAVTERLHP
jgi:hypothetical protein